MFLVTQSHSNAWPKERSWFSNEWVSKVTCAFLCTCACLHVCAYAYMHATVHIWRSEDNFLSQKLSPEVILTGLGLLTKLASSGVCLSLLLQRCSNKCTLPCLPVHVGSGDQTLCLHSAAAATAVPAYAHGFWGANPSPYICTASTFWVESFLSSWSFFMG